MPEGRLLLASAACLASAGVLAVAGLGARSLDQLEPAARARAQVGVTSTAPPPRSAATRLAARLAGTRDDGRYTAALVAVAGVARSPSGAAGQRSAAALATVDAARGVEQDPRRAAQLDDLRAVLTVLAAAGHPRGPGQHPLEDAIALLRRSVRGNPYDEQSKFNLELALTVAALRQSARRSAPRPGDARRKGSGSKRAQAPRRAAGLPSAGTGY